MTPDDVDINPNFEKNTPFRVPSGYFDQLADSITMRCTEMPATTKQTSWRTALRGQLGLAAGFAVLALLASMAYFYMQQITPTQQSQPHKMERVNIVSRHISPEQYWERQQQRLQQQRTIDSLKDFTHGKRLRYNTQQSDFSSISEEKWDAPATLPQK